MTVQRMSTGVLGLDALLEGGLPLNRSILVCGGTGTGKTILGLQFLMDGVRRNEPGVLVSVDEKPQHVVEDASRFGWDLQRATEQSLLSVLDASPYFMARRGNTPPEPRQVASDLVQQVRKIGARRLVVDSLTSLISEEASPAIVKDFLRSLLSSLEDNLGCTVLLMSQTSAATDRLAVWSMAEFMVSGVIELKLAQIGERAIARAGGIARVPVMGRSLFVRKMRATQVEPCEHLFDILPDLGLALRDEAASG